MTSATFDVPERFLADDGTVLVYAKTDTDYPAGIQQGDYLIVEPTDTAEGGQVVIVSEDDGHSVVRFRDGSEGVRVVGRVKWRFREVV